MDDELASYRDHLVQSEQKSLEACDKSLLGSSSGDLPTLYEPGRMGRVLSSTVAGRYEESLRRTP